MLSNEDIRILIQALDSHEKVKVADAGMGNFFSRMLGESKAEQEQELASQAERLHYSIILLQAKLIGMMDKGVIAEVEQFLQGGADA